MIFKRQSKKYIRDELRVNYNNIRFNDDVIGIRTRAMMKTSRESKTVESVYKKKPLIDQTPSSKDTS